jgi:serine acetyltransferase
MFHDLIEELKNNDGIKSKYVVLSYRMANSISQKNKLVRILLCPVIIQYQLLVNIFWGVEIPYKITIGCGMKISHAKCITIHPSSQIGKNVHLRHGVTLGNKETGFKEAPIIGDNVEFGCFSTLLGNISVGNNSVIGAHTLLLKTVPNNSIVTGVPGKVASR